MNTTKKLTGEKILNIFLRLFLSLYLAIVIGLSVFLAQDGTVLFLGIFVFVLTLLFYFLLEILLEKMPNLQISRSKTKDKLSWKLFAGVSGGLFALYVLYLLAHYPGAICTDAVTQWRQVISGDYSA